MKMQIERVIADVESLGPGKRICIWVNGCRRNCPGCVSPELKEFKSENACDVENLLDKFRLGDYSGVTISGGEPFEQTEALASLVRYLRGRGVEDILIYTGYTIEELNSRAVDQFNIKYILDNIGVLIDGPYFIDQDDGKGNLKGSKNQRIIFINDKLIDKYEKYASPQRKMQEFLIFPHFVGVGIPTKEYIEKFKHGG